LSMYPVSQAKIGKELSEKQPGIKANENLPQTKLKLPALPGNQEDLQGQSLSKDAAQ
ncbi:hypothetical protein SK128_021205, partial [Halocaridina rubra]